LGEEQEEAGLPTHSRDELLGMDRDSLKDEISQLEAKLQKITDVDLGVLREYRRRVEEHATRSADLSEALAKRDTAKKRCDELRKLRLEGFMEGFSIISMRLKEMYQMITMGGNAELELVDSLDPFSEGILFSVMPPKKSWKNISNLSGGEKTLSSLALVFALHHYKPTPLYVMDEIDAALDFRNVGALHIGRPRLMISGIDCSQLHQGTDQEWPVYCYIASKQHGRFRIAVFRERADICSLNLPRD
jgi:structural maintenance of chromosome 4